MPNIRVSISHAGQWQRSSGEMFSLLVSPAMSQKALQSLAARSIQELEAEIVRQSFDNFTILVLSDDYVIYKPDIVNRRAIFYTDNGRLIADDLYSLPSNDFDLTSIKQYILAGYVTGSATLLQGVRKSQAGELLRFTDDGVSTTEFFGYRYSKQTLTGSPNAPHVEAGHFQAVLNDVISDALSGRERNHQIVVPLSGGHDSRLLLNQLAALGYKNVICFSYGTPGNTQSAISERVATALGYPWHFVEYTEEKWLGLHQRGVVNAYCQFAHRGGSTPNMQDFLAVWELLEDGIIHPGDFILPGHTLDFIAGGHVDEQDFACADKRQAVEHVMRRHFPEREALTVDDDEVRKRLEEQFDLSGCGPEFFQEWFNWRERQCKFIVNSTATYECFGLKTILPFWDARVVRYWLNIPPKVKSQRAVFFAMERSLLAEKLSNIPFAEVVGKKPSFGGKVKLGLRSILPASLTSYLVRTVRLKGRLDEGLNMAFATLGVDIRSVVPEVARHPIANFGPVHSILPRRPYQISGHKMASLYTLNLMLCQRSAACSHDDGIC